MKKQLTVYLCAIILLNVWNASGQTIFWSEDFGTGCSQGNLANNFTTSNGVWTMSQTGYNANYANEWYISATEAGMGVNNCGNGCLNNSNLTNRTLHVGNVAIISLSIPADNGASYYSSSSVCNQLSICGSTQKRIESPVIDCSGQSSITLRFLYMENGGNTTHNATVWYSSDGGSNWSQLYDPPKTALTCNPQGIWTLDSIALPSSADNNPSVKIGFEWFNDENDNATDPSFAVDDIELYVPASGPTPVADFSVSDTNICENDCISFTDLSTNSPTSWFWAFPGGTPSTSTQQNPDSICYAVAGTYDVTLVVFNGNGGDTLVKTNHITVNVCTGTDEAGRTLLLPASPNPATSNTVIRFNGLDVTGISIYNVAGQQVQASTKLGKNRAIIFHRGLPNGIYFYRLMSASGSALHGKIIFE
ncbi:MAG: T9SS type A sorting domain-containing protein [Flavobacteriales bacterium]